MADVEFDCPKCGGHLSVADRGAGMFVPCPECGQTIQVPQADKTKPGSFTFTCKYCSKTLSCSIDRIGEVIECPVCHQLTLVSKTNPGAEATSQKDTANKKRFSIHDWIPNRQSHKGTPQHLPKECEMTKKQGSIIITLLLIALGFPFFSFFRPAQTCEYKHITVRAGLNKRTGTDAFEYSSIKFNDSDLDALGKCGWELVGSYLELETAFPNFGKTDYVTGLQPNIRPQCLVLIFKRPINIFSAFMDGYYYTGTKP